MKDIEKLKQQYEVWCIINNLVVTEQGFKGYISDRKMLERIREKRSVKNAKGIIK